MVRSDTCTDEHELNNSTSAGHEQSAAPTDAPTDASTVAPTVTPAVEDHSTDTPTVAVKVDAANGMISFEQPYAPMNSESASSFMSILEQHADSASNRGLIDAVLARNTDTPAPIGPITLPQTQMEQTRNKLNQLTELPHSEPITNPTNVTITNGPSGAETTNQPVHNHDANLPQTVAVRPQLIVVRGERLDVSYPILPGKNFIGRMADQPVDIDLESQEPVERIWTSRQHAVITYENGSIILEDLASLNGTFVNRTRLYPGHAKLLQPGDILQIGTVQLRVSVE